MLRSGNGIEIEWVSLCGILKHMGIFVVRLKAIKHKENSSYYLFS